MWRETFVTTKNEISSTWNGCNLQENISNSYLLTGQARLRTISCKIGTQYFLMSKSYLRTGQTRLSIIVYTMGTPSFWQENNIFECFPASSFEVDLFIFYGITETTQIVFALAILSPIRLRKIFRLTLPILLLPWHHPMPLPSWAARNWQSLKDRSRTCFFCQNQKRTIGKYHKRCRRYHRPSGTHKPTSQSWHERGTSPTSSK